MIKNTQKTSVKWPTKTMSEIVEFAYGQNLPKEKRITGNYEVYGSNGVVGSHNQFFVEGPGIIIGRKGSIGKVIYSDKNFWPIDTTYYVKPIDELDSKWLYYCLQILKLDKLNSATGVPGLNRNDVYSKKILFPPINTQQKIATILSTIDEAIQKTDQIIEKTEKLKMGLMLKFFNNELSTEWTKYDLGDIAKFIDYRGKTPKKTTSGIPLITAKNVRMGLINREPREYISLVDYPIWMTRGIPKKGDVLITTEAPLGNIAQVDTDDKLAFAQRVIILQCSEEIQPTFLKYLLMSRNTQSLFRSLSTGGTVKGIKAKVLKQIKISVPSTDKQNEICDIVGTIDLKLNFEKANKEKLNILKNGLMNDIFSQKMEVV